MIFIKQIIFKQIQKRLIKSGEYKDKSFLMLNWWFPYKNAWNWKEKSFDSLSEKLQSRENL